MLYCLLPSAFLPPWRTAQGEKRVKRADVMGYRPAPAPRSRDILPSLETQPGGARTISVSFSLCSLGPSYCGTTQTNLTLPSAWHCASGFSASLVFLAVIDLVRARARVRARLGLGLGFGLGLGLGLD